MHQLVEAKVQTDGDGCAIQTYFNNMHKLTSHKYTITQKIHICIYAHESWKQMTWVLFSTKQNELGL